MGFAKYHEDDLGIIDERLYGRNIGSQQSVFSNYTRTVTKIKYKVFCPFCRCGFMTYENLIDHVLKTHGGIHEFIYINNRRVTGNEETFSKVNSFKLYCFREEPREIQLIYNNDKIYSFYTKKDKYEYDINKELKTNVYSEIRIINIDFPVCIKQKLDIDVVSMKDILSGKYSSDLFVDQISEGSLTTKGYLTYFKMLIHENYDTDSFIDLIKQMHLDSSRELSEIYYYNFLWIRSKLGVKGKSTNEIVESLICLLNGDYFGADKILSKIEARSNDKYGCQILVNLLTNDKLSTDYLFDFYEPFGIIGCLNKILFHYANYKIECSNVLANEFDEIKLFLKYPLIKALVELNDSINNSSTLSYESYLLLEKLTPLAAIHYCYSIDDKFAKEKIHKSMLEIHKDSYIVKEYALQNNYSWIKRRIFVSDGTLYEKEVLKENQNLGGVFSKRFITEFPFDDKIQITPLGGEHKIGASCFVISYKGYNVMLDCGINTQKYGDSAYPCLDSWSKDIDAIIISHAHIDHSGGVSKAHSMWPEAKIIATAPTKVFLKYLYADMAKVKNGIIDEFEIVNVKIEKDVMIDTLNSIITFGYKEWIYIGKDIKIRLHPAGHIIGAAMIELVIDGKVLLYTGDYCDYNQVLTGNLDLYSLPQNVDYLITESTYIRRSKVDWNGQYNELKSTITNKIKERQAILLPAASVGRSQELVCIIGEMKLSGEISNEIPLYIAGMAIPATTQIAPFMNERYEEIIKEFREFNGILYPEQNAIVIASSGSMSKNSASYKISKYWDKNNIEYIILANGYLDEDFEVDCESLGGHSKIKRLPLSTHVDINGMINLIEYVRPKVISFVHRGSESKDDINSLIDRCKRIFSDDIMCRDLMSKKCNKIFDMYEWFLEGVINNDKREE